MDGKFSRDACLAHKNAVAGKRCSDLMHRSGGERPPPRHGRSRGFGRLALAPEEEASTLDLDAARCLEVRPRRTGERDPSQSQI